MFTKQLFAKSIVFLVIVLFVSFATINAQTSKVPTAPATEFTYQGKLNNGTVAANGTYDFKFDIYDAETGGGIVQTITVTGVTVANGIFTVKLGVNPVTFGGDERFLEIWATNTGTFTSPMTPRQKVTSSPYAVRAKDADNAVNATNATNATFATNAGNATTAFISNLAVNSESLGGVLSTNYVKTNDARLTDARTPTAGSGDYIQNGTAVQTSNFNVSGNGSANVLNAQSEYGLGGFRVMTTIGGNLFVGYRAGYQGTVIGTGNSFFGDSSGRGNRGNDNSYFGRSTDGDFDGIASGSNNTLLGASSKLSVVPFMKNYATAVGSGSIVNSSNTIQLGRNGTDIVKIGVLDSAGATSVCLNGSNALATCSSSIRYKNNIQDFRFGLDLIKRLRPVTFNWKADNKADMGLVAEEVNAVEPLLTTTNKDGEVEGVKYDRVGVVLVNAVNEQQVQIEAQQKEIERLKTELDSLKKLVCAVNQNADVCKPKEQK
jgi:Chaperone of endosialidase